MNPHKYLLLFLSSIIFILSQFCVAGAEKPNHQRFDELSLISNPCGNGLEVSDYKKLKIFIEDLTGNNFVTGLTRRNLQAKCEVRLMQAGIEPVADKEEYLYIKVELVKDAYALSMRFLRPTLFKTAKMIFRKPGTDTWERNIIGLHMGNIRYIFEGLDSLLD